MSLKTRIAAAGAVLAFAGAAGALETLGELFDKHGAMHDMQYHGGRGAGDAAVSCHKAGWSIRDAARHLADALAARAR